MKRLAFIVVILTATLLSSCKKDNDLNVSDSGSDGLSMTVTTKYGYNTGSNVDTTYITIISGYDLKPENFVDRYWLIPGYSALGNFAYELYRGGDKKRIDFKFTSSTSVKTTDANPLTYPWIRHNGMTYDIKLGK